MTIKLGPHILEPTPAALQFAGSASLILALDNAIGSVVGPYPNAQTVFRHYFPNQDLNRHGADIAAEIISVLNQRGGIRPSYVQLYNEAGNRWSDNIPRYVDLHREAVPLLHANGLRVAGYAFSTGSPDTNNFGIWDYLRDNNYGDVDAIILHEYWGNCGFTPQNALRHRVVHDYLAGNHPPFIIGECGRDQVYEVAGPSCGLVGCFDHCGWRKYGVTADQYVSELLAYDAELANDPYVIGAAGFTAGAVGGEWHPFDVDELVPRILGQVVPGPGPGPQPTRGRLPIAPILLIGLAGLLGTYAAVSAYTQLGEANEGMV